MKYLLALLLSLTTFPVLANMDDDFPAPIDFEEEESIDASNAPIEADGAILLPQEATRKMASRPMVVKPAPPAPRSKEILNKAKAENLKKKQAQAIKRLNKSVSKRASK